VGDLGVVDAADLADDGVDRARGKPAARAAGSDRDGGQEQGLAVVVGVAGSLGFDVVSYGLARVAAEETVRLMRPLPRMLSALQPGGFVFAGGGEHSPVRPERHAP